MQEDAYLLVQYERCYTLWQEVLRQALRDAINPPSLYDRPTIGDDLNETCFFRSNNESLLRICGVLGVDHNEIIKRVRRGQNAVKRDA